MNLHAVVSGAIGAINPHQQITLRVSTGYATNAAGKRSPAYAAPVSLTAQVQDLSSRDLLQLSGLGIQGSQKTVYCNGSIDGVVRVTQKGGDLITLADGSVWLTTQVLEQWDTGWCKVAITLQNGS